jgi:AcrR family transcriptional regulator
LVKLTGDARADRWYDHRALVRAELVEATLRAVDEYGPNLSIDDVVKTAGVPRPKLYRFFSDKFALFEAVSERAQQLIIERVVPHFDLTGTALELVRSALTAYVDLVDERPNLFRFLIGSHFSDGRSAPAILESDSQRQLAEATADVAAAILRARGGDADNLEYFTDSMLGAVAYGALRWLNAPTISKAALVDQLTVIVWGAISATAQMRGVVLDPDEPLSLPDSAD